MRNNWFVVTVTFEWGLADTGSERARIVADSLMSDPAVVTVRIGREGDASVCRVDIEADTAVIAAARAVASIVDLLGGAGAAPLGAHAADVVLESERPVFLQ